MLYRKLGKTDENVSILGFGCMRLPVKKVDNKCTHVFERNKNVDEEKSIEMIQYALDQGVNYFDTAYNYHGGNSEKVLGKALRGHRDRILIATKLPTFW